MNVFEEIEKLNLPKDQFMILGSSILSVLGIRDIGDIDLLVRPELFEQMISNNWKYEVIEIDGKMRNKLSKGPVEAYKDFWWEGEILEAEAGFVMAEKIDGINFLPLEILLKVKKTMNREKDVQDVILIEEYLKNIKTA